MLYCLFPVFQLFSISKRARARAGREGLLDDLILQASKGRRKGAPAQEEVASAGLGCQLEICLRDRSEGIMQAHVNTTL